MLLSIAVQPSNCSLLFATLASALDLAHIAEASLRSAVDQQGVTWHADRVLIAVPLRMVSALVYFACDFSLAGHSSRYPE